MTDTTFRTREEIKPEADVSPPGKEPTRSGDETPREDAPYLDYGVLHSHPFTVDYFELGDRWDDPKGGYPEEIAVIEEYMERRIKSGDMANTIDAVKEELKNLEKVNGIKKEERLVIKIETIAAYAKFLMETDKTKYNVMKYANH